VGLIPLSPHIYGVCLEWTRIGYDPVELIYRFIQQIKPLLAPELPAENLEVESVYN
jgi:hypothetical protein